MNYRILTLHFSWTSSSSLLQDSFILFVFHANGCGISWKWVWVWRVYWEINWGSDDGKVESVLRSCEKEETQGIMCSCVCWHSTKLASFMKRRAFPSWYSLNIIESRTLFQHNSFSRCGSSGSYTLWMIQSLTELSSFLTSLLEGEVCPIQKVQFEFLSFQRCGVKKSDLIVWTW